MFEPADQTFVAIISTVVTVSIATGFSLLLLVSPRRPALQAWVASLWLMVVSVGLTVFIEKNSMSTLFPLLCLFALLASVFLLKGMAFHVGQRLPVWKPLVVMGFFMALIAHQGFFYSEAGRQVPLFNVATIVLNGWIVWMLLRRTPAELRLSYRLAACIFGINVVLAVGSLAPVGEGDTVPVIDNAAVNLAVICLGIILAMAQCFALMLLIVEQMLVELRKRASNDGLTGLLNRATLVTQGLKQLATATAKAQPFSVFIIDLDHFKRVNDTWGHLSGDAVLRHFARTATECAAAQPNLLARYGGEEFVLMVPNMAEADALALAQRLVEAVRSASVPTTTGTVSYTVSIGVSCAQPGSTLEQLLAQADVALYRAKAEGRNQACMATSGEGAGIRAPEGSAETAAAPGLAVAGI